MSINLNASAIAPLIDSAINNTKSLVPNHWNTLLGERSSGSQFGFNMSEKIIKSIPWELTLPHEYDLSEISMSKYLPDCIYLTCKVENMPHVNIKGVGKARANMTNNIALLHEIIEFNSSAKLITNFYPYQGEHGWELRSAQVKKSTPATCISMVIGKEQDQLVIYTIHPDPVAQPLPKCFTETGDIARLIDDILANINANSEYLPYYTTPHYAVKAF